MTDDELKNLIAERDMLVQIKIDLTAKVGKLEATLAASDAELLSLKNLLRSTPSVEINAKVYSLSDVSMFLGWVCVELPELHNLECPKLLEAWYKYCAQMGIPSASDTAAKS
jgi:hypothetical protein